MRLACIAVVAALAACGGEEDRGDGGGPYADDTACALADGIFPGEELSDWKGYADHVALVEVVDERRDENDFPVQSLAVRERYWSADRAPALPGQVDVSTFPYMLEGRTYVAPLIRFDRDEAWVVQSCEAPIPVSEEGKVVGSDRPSPGFQPLKDRLAGEPAGSFAARMDAAEVPRRLRRFMHLRPEQRAHRAYGG